MVINAHCCTLLHRLKTHFADWILKSILVHMKFLFLLTGLSITLKYDQIYMYFKSQFNCIHTDCTVVLRFGVGMQ